MSIPQLPYDFYSKENMKLLIDICSDYMREKHGIYIDSLEDIKTHKKLVYTTMNEVYDLHKDKPHQQLNVLVLTSLKEHYIKRSKSLETQRPNLASLKREAEVYGKRPLSYNELIPENSKKDFESVSKPFDRLIDERDKEFNNNTRPDISKLGKQIRELPEESDSFLKKLDLLHNDRESIFNTMEPPMVTPSFEDPIQQNLPLNKVQGSLDQDTVMDRLIVDNQTRNDNDINNQDPKAFFSNPISTQLLGSGDSKPYNKSEHSQLSLNTPFNTSESFLNPRVARLKQTKKYLSINSVDRDWNLQPMRYKYSINSLGDNNDLQKRYRNIESISVGKVIIPEEIIEKATLTNQNLKPFFNHDFSFAYPYLILQIDEFTDVYDGTNDAVRKAFSTLIYDCSYKAPNGRGYIILKPMQKEKKTFYPTPLSSFSKLSISILKPNGDVLNKSADSYKVTKVEYEAFNTHFLKIVTDVYFDKNEFFVGDEIIIKGHNMTLIAEDMNEFDTSKFNDFINRKEGHEIKQIGQANDSGYFRTFYIQAPGTFDKNEGRFVIENNLITALNAYNVQINFCDPSVLSNGMVLNNSLQNTVSLKLDILIDDARIIEREIL
jgi:hypothetical protein